MPHPLKRIVWLLVSLPLAAIGAAHAADTLSQPIKVSPDGHFLAQPDGEPFFWLGDTAWTLFARLNREETEEYLRDRASKGFTVIQAVAVGGPWYGLDVPNRYQELPLIQQDPARPNRRYFEHIDWVVERAASYGIRVALLPVWSISLISRQPGLFTESKARTYGRWLGQRYRHKGIIWMLGGDTNPLWLDSVQREFPSVVDHRPLYDALAQGLIEGEGGEPFITYHPTGLSFSGSAVPRTSLYFHDRPWLDMNMIQSGHFIDASAHLKRVNADFSWDGTRNYEPILEEYRSSPTRPVVDGEARFEGLNIDLDETGAKGFWSGYDARNAAYHAVFAGAAGHTYGHHSIWQFVGAANQSYQLGEHAASWHAALASESSQQMHYLKELMLSRPYFIRIPDQSLIAGETGSGDAHIGATRAKDGSYALIYLPQGQKVVVEMSKLCGLRATAWWFDPRTGAATRIKDTYATTGSVTFTPPSNGAEHDWVLVLDDESKAFAPPGSFVNK